MDKWNKRYLDVAKLISTFSKDPGAHVGAIAVGSDGQILSQGYNGFPRGISDSEDRLNDRHVKLKYTIHAEMNVVFNASLTGVSLKDSDVYVYGLPICSDCAKGLIQAGVKKVVIPLDSIKMSEYWSDSWMLSRSMFDEAGVEIVIEQYE